MPPACTAAAGLVVCSCYTIIKRRKKERKDRKEGQTEQMLDPAEITGATVIRLLAVAEVVRPLGACLSEKHQNHCVKKLGFPFCLVTPTNKIIKSLQH